MTDSNITNLLNNEEEEEKRRKEEEENQKIETPETDALFQTSTYASHGKSSNPLTTYP